MSRSPDLATLADRSPAAASRAPSAARSGPASSRPATGCRPSARSPPSSASARPPSVPPGRRCAVRAWWSRAAAPGTFVRETPRAVAEPAPAGWSAPAPTACGWTSRAAPPTRRCCPSLGPAFGRVSARAGHRRLPGRAGAAPAPRSVLEATWPYPAEAITVVDGATDGIARVLEQCVHLGDRVVARVPRLPAVLRPRRVARRRDRAGGDGRLAGVRPDSLRAALDARPVAVVLQPRAQNPTGISMSPERAPQRSRRC